MAVSPFAVTSSRSSALSSPFAIQGLRIGGRPDEPDLGFLGTLGKILDFPGNTLRSILAGRPFEEVSGADLLEKYFGLQNKRGEFDLADIPAFLAEVALDPLTYVGGIGTLNRAGRLSRDAARGISQARKLRDSRRILEAELKGALRSGELGDDAIKALRRQIQDKAIQQKAETAAIRSLRQQADELGIKFAPGRFDELTFSGAGREGLRDALSLSLPFAKNPFFSVRGQPVLDLLEKTGVRLDRVPAINKTRRGLQGFFQKSANKSADVLDLEQFAREQRNTLSQSQIADLENLKTLRDEAFAEGVTNKELVDAIESLGAKERIARRFGTRDAARRRVTGSEEAIAQSRTEKGILEQARRDEAARIGEAQFEIGETAADVRALRSGARKLSQDEFEELLLKRAGSLEGSGLPDLQEETFNLADQLGAVRGAKGDLAKALDENKQVLGAIEEAQQPKLAQAAAEITEQKGEVRRLTDSAKALRTEMSKLKREMKTGEDFLPSARFKEKSTTANAAFQVRRLDDMLKRTRELQGAAREQLSAARGARKSALGKVGAAKQKISAENAELYQTLLDAREAERTLTKRMTTLLDARESELKRKLLQAGKKGKGGAQYRKLTEEISQVVARRRAHERALVANRALARRTLREFPEFSAEASRRAMKTLKNANPKSVEFAEAFSRVMDTALDLEQSAGARAMNSRLRDGVLAYFPRVLTKEWANTLRDNPEVFGQLTGRMGARLMGSATGDQIKRTGALFETFTTDITADMVLSSTDKALLRLSGAIDNIDEARRAMIEVAEGASGEMLAQNIFEVDPIQAAGQRLMNGAVARANVNTTETAIRNFARPAAELGEGAVPIQKVAETMGLHRLFGETVSAKGLNVNRILAAKGFSEDLAIPVEIFASMKEVAERFNSPKAFRKLGESLGKATGFWKTWLTSANPGFHVRNLISDHFLSWLGDGIGSPQVFARSSKSALDEVTKYVASGGRVKGEAIRDLERAGIVGGQVSEALEQLKTGTARGGSGIERLYGLSSTSRGENAKAIFSRGLRSSDLYSRVRHWHARRMMGDSPKVARDSVRKYLLDYSNLTASEQKLNSWILFYNWSRQVLPRIASSFFETPGKAVALTRLTTAPTAEREGPLPRHLRETSAIPLSRSGGIQKFLASTASPFEELNKIPLGSPEGGVLGAVREGVRKVAGQLNPMAKYPIELATGRNLFFDEDIINLDRMNESQRMPIIGSLLRWAAGAQDQKLEDGSTRTTGDPFVQHLFNSSPFSRFARSGGQFFSPGGRGSRGKTPGEDLLQVFTGFNVDAVDPLDRVRAEVRQLEDQAKPLRRSGEIGEFNRLFKTDAGAQNPEVQLLLQRIEAANKRKKALLTN